jgi:putative glutamine amidotransferase
MHHQAIKDVAPGFTTCAYSEDGLIEAIESVEHRFVYGVQWHPEHIWGRDRLSRAVVGEFVAVSGGEERDAARPTVEGESEQ